VDNGEHLHRRLSDASLAPYFGRYFKILRWLRRSGVKWFNRVYENKYYTAHVSLKDGDHLHVSLDPRDASYFEFFTTGKPIVTGTVTQGGVPVPSVKAACVGVDITLKHGQLTVHPRINTGARSFAGEDISRVKRPFQVALVNEPVVNPPPKTLLLGRTKHWHMLYESYAPMHSHTGVHFRSYNKGPFTFYSDGAVSVTPHAGLDFAGEDSITITDGVKIIKTDYNVSSGIPIDFGPISAHAARDIRFDVPYQDGTADKPVREALLNDGVVDWPRANGVVTIKNQQYGDREFAIYIDAFSQFSVFPTGQIGEINDTIQNVPGMYVITRAPTLPAWVYQMSQRFIDWYAANSTTGLTDFPEIDWKVSHDGTKACAVVYERSAVNFQQGFFSDQDEDGDHPGRQESRFNTYIGQTGFAARYGDSVSGIVDIAGDSQRYISAPGLIEATLTIEITGPEPEDFTFTVTVAELRRPTTSEFCPLIAGYVWHDIPNPAGGFYALQGDLCVLDIERYYRPPANGTSFPFSAIGNGADLYSLKNLSNGGVEIANFHGPVGDVSSTVIPVYILGLMDFDMATLSFAFTAIRINPVIIHATVVYTFNTFREILFPDNIPQADKDWFLQLPGVDYRSTFITGSTFTRLALNDIPLWTDSDDLEALREHIAWENCWATLKHPKPWLDQPWADNPSHATNPNPVNVPTYATKVWFSAMRTRQTAHMLAAIDKPQFAWFVYSDMIMSALQKTPWSTFFVHPNGTWALFDQSRIYNYGLRNTVLTTFDATKLEHFINDRVHFEFRLAGKAYTLDTSFVQLYNDAVAALPDDAKNDFAPLTYTGMRATFTKQTDSTTFVTWLKLQMVWDGFTYYFEDSAINNRPSEQIQWEIQGGWQSLNLTVDGFWGVIGSPRLSPQQTDQHTTFSSCLLIE